MELEGKVDLPPGAVIRPMPAKLSPNLELDGVHRIDSADNSWIEHFEFKSQYHVNSRRQRMKYVCGLYLGPEDLPILSTMIVVLPDNFPKSYEEMPSYDVPGVVSFAFRTVKLFEVELLSNKQELIKI